MEIFLIIVVVSVFAAAMYQIIFRGPRKERERDHAAEILAASEAASKRRMVEPLPISHGPFIHTGRARMTRSAMASQPPAQTTVVREDNTGSLLMAGAVGYMLANSGNSHAHESHSRSEPAPDLSCRPSDGDYGGSGSSSSWDSGSSSDSSSSSRKYVVSETTD